MAKGKATKATKAKSGGVASTAKPQPKASATQPTPVKAKSASEAKAPKAAPAAAPAAPAAPGVKKKNVKRGAPPMLPRRMAKRPEPSAGPPAAPRLVTAPGSLHAPARAPEGAESLKQQLSTVMGLLAQLRAFKRTLNRQFYDAGLVLQRLSEPALYQAKGYGSFDKFVEREVEKELAIGRSLAQDLVQIVRIFQREPAEELGLDRLRDALRKLFPEPGPQVATSSGPGSSG